MFSIVVMVDFCFFFFQAEDGIRDSSVTGVQTCALPISQGSVLTPENYWMRWICLAWSARTLPWATCCRTCASSSTSGNKHDCLPQEAHRSRPAHRPHLGTCPAREVHPARAHLHLAHLVGTTAPGSSPGAY